MGFTTDPVGLGRVFAGLLLVALAALPFLARPDARQTRRLGLLFLVMGGIEVARGLAILSDNVDQARGFWAVTTVQFVMLPFLELLFIATLRTRLVAWLRLPWVERTLAALALLLPWPVWLQAGAAAPYITPGTDILVLSLQDPAVGKAIGAVRFVVLASYAIFLFAIVAAVSAFRQAAPGSLARRQARAYLLAFALGDGWWLLVNGVVRPFLLDEGAFWSAVSAYGGPFIMQPIFAILITYGILKAHLFDIDLRIKWTLRRGTVALVILAAFVGTTAGVQEWLGQTQGVLAGAIAAGLLVLALQPLQRLADRVSNAAMPDVEDSESYRVARKLDVYRDAVEALLLDGVITRKERILLVRLRSQLGISAPEAAALERQAATASASA